MEAALIATLATSAVNLVVGVAALIHQVSVRQRCCCCETDVAVENQDPKQDNNIQVSPPKQLKYGTMGTA